MLSGSRAHHETKLAVSLSRHIGYTTGAFYINRIASIASEFQGQPSRYQFELTQYLMTEFSDGNRSVNEKYATEILNFAVSLGIIYRAAEGATPRVNRFAITPEGATIRSALSQEDEGLAKFALLGLVLESDSDTYALLLDILYESCVSGQALYALFEERFRQLREDRIAWLSKSLSESRPSRADGI